MASFNMTFNVPDAQVVRVANALKRRFGMPTATNAELIERLRQEFIVTFKALVKSGEVEAAEEQKNAIQLVDMT